MCVEQIKKMFYLIKFAVICFFRLSHWEKNRAIFLFTHKNNADPFNDNENVTFGAIMLSQFV